MPKKDAKIDTAATSSPSKYRLPIVIGKVKGVFQIICIKLTIKVRDKTMQVELLDDEDGYHEPYDVVGTVFFNALVPASDPSEPPLLELTLSCDNLLCDALGRPPSARVVLSVGDEAGLGLRWARFAQTEIAEKSSNPVYLRTITVRLILAQCRDIS